MVSTIKAYLIGDWWDRKEIRFQDKNTFKLQTGNDEVTLAGILCEQGDQFILLVFLAKLFSHVLGVASNEI